MALAAVHRRYAGRVHERRRTGNFWQSRFGSVALDEAHLCAALRYIAFNPLRAGLVDQARDWRSPRNLNLVHCHRNPCHRNPRVRNRNRCDLNY